jgi:hypothetical protein
VKKNLNSLADAIGSVLVDGAGFSRDKLRFTRADGLDRRVWLIPGKNASSATHPFELIFDIGMPKLRELATDAQPWVVRASAEKVYRKSTPVPRVKFIFFDGIYDDDVERVVIDVLRHVCDEFFLTMTGPEELYDLVRRNALTFLWDAMAAENEFKRLDLMPWNVVPRLQLAAVYAASLGHSVEASELENEIVTYAGKNRLDHLLTGIRQSIATASR